jgi:hypothetical protein
MSEQSPSPERNELHDIDDAAACALVGEMLGAADEWRSPIIKYRFSSDFQAHWKAEIGHWVNTARVHGYESRLVERTRARANDARRRIPDDVTTADLLYRVLLEELHPAMVAHYLLKTGWGFRAWGTPDGAGGDVDLAATSPDGVPVDIQIKVPGSENPLAALEKGARQLLATKNHALIFVCSRDPLFVSCEPGEFLVGLVGNTVGEHRVVTLTEQGRFGSAEWTHVGAVALLDYIPGAERQTYACTALLNPWCQRGAAVERSWLPRARVLRLEDDRFRWHPIEPDRAFEVPDGTYVPEQLRAPGGPSRLATGV